MNAHAVTYAPQQPPAAIDYYAQNKGTLHPGQVIQIQSLTVTVERFLSQGGFAHVYLVRSASPVNGTTHHVLKRMLVQDQLMLGDVKREVDIMKILRGHANIVNLIDSAYNRLPDGRFEVFILMEFCAGGGIIDMMNRRLRERLTEGEILQIFVDVCEGVAAMHHLQPPLLHRDLKVENILQANENSYKLCDFGSATAVSKPPTTAAEMRAVEYDLNRHTTLQYRAPEMVDPQLRRPIDEKSDVWALGVLLYKLCYYTTPFEEHGPLAILNVQYKIPPYPVYSQGMIGMIMSILREHGPQRPTVFEILDTVHRMRGTKSRYRYAPAPAPPQTLPRSPEDIIFRSPVDKSVPPAIQARQTVLDAINPMRRGRPNIPPSGTAVLPSGPASGPGKVGVGPGAGAGGALLHSYADDLDIPTPRGGHFKSMTTNERWSSAREAPAALGGSVGGGRMGHLSRPSEDKKGTQPQSGSPWDGLGSLDSTERAVGLQGFGDSFDPLQSAQRRNFQNVPMIQSPPASSSSGSTQPVTSPQSLASPPPSQQSRFTMPTPSRLLSAGRPPLQTQTKPKDSFDGVGPSMSAPTSSNMNLMRPPSNASQNGLVSAFSRPSTAAESVVSTGTGFSSAAVVEGAAALSAAERFPTIEQLEFVGGREKPPPAPLGPRAHSPTPLRAHSPIPLRAHSPIRRELVNANRPPMYAGLSRMNYTGGLTLDHDVLTPPSAAPMSGVRSQQVTGTAMKGGVPSYPAPNAGPNPAATSNANANMPPPTAFLRNSALANRFPTIDRPPSRFPTAERPLAPRRGPTNTRKRGSASDNKVEPVQAKQQPHQEHDLLGPGPAGPMVLTQRTPSPSAVPPAKDWLMDDDVVLATVPRASTGSLQPRLPTPDPGFVDPNKAKRATMGTALLYNGRVGLAGMVSPTAIGPASGAGGMGALNTTRGTMDPPPSGWQRSVMNQSSQPMSPPTMTRPTLPRRTSNEGQQVAGRRRSNTATRAPQLEAPQFPSRNQQARAGSPQLQPKATTSGHTLSDNWSPIERNFPPAAGSTFGEAQTGAESSGEDGPEDVNASTLKRLRMRNQVGRIAESLASGGEQKKDLEQANRHQGRQGSVHDLVDLWSNTVGPLSAGGQKQEDAAGHQKAPSRDLMNFADSQDSPVLTSAFNRATHLFPPVDATERRQSLSSGSGSEKDTDAPPRPPKRFSAPKFRPSHISVRPQSMFISPGASSIPYPTRHSPDDSLSVPTSAGAGPTNRQRTPRRGSISDMVSLFEAKSAVSAATSATSGYTASTESGLASPKPKPHISTKPAALRSPGMPSASSVARRGSLLKTFTANPLSPHGGGPTSFSSLDVATSSMQKDVKMSAPIKMRTSPLLFKALESPTESTQSFGGYSKDRESAPESFYQPPKQNLQPPQSAGVDRTSSPGSNQGGGAISDANDDILLVSPRPRAKHQSIEYHSEAPIARTKTPPSAHSPSPEAYKGVGKLIDQWQKKSEEAEGKARGMKPGGPRQQRKDVLPGRAGSNN